MLFWKQARSVATASSAILMTISGGAIMTLSAGEIEPVVQTPKPPEGNAVKAEKKVKVEEANKPNGGKVVNGLQLQLVMDQDKIIEGQPWTGVLKAVNVSDKPLDVFLSSDVEVLLSRTDGKPVDRTTYLGSGFFDPNEERKNIRTLKPGERTEACWFNQRAAYSMLGGHGGRILAFGWRLTEGTYRLRVQFKIDASYAKKFGLPPVWLGTAESNEVTVDVNRAPGLNAPVTKGLQVTLVGTPDKLSVRFQNVSKKPMVVDVGSLSEHHLALNKIRIKVRNAAGDLLPGYLEASSLPTQNRKQQFKELAPGGFLWIGEYGPETWRAMQNTGGAPRHLKPGTYTLIAEYQNTKDESAALGAPGPAWVGETVSNEVQIRIPGEKAKQATERNSDHEAEY